MSLLKEFRPALIFLGKFLAVYFIGNLVYGIFVESFENSPDNITVLVAKQTCWFLDKANIDCVPQINPTRPTVDLYTDGKRELAIFEGCNGINVMIVFIAFVVAYGGSVVSQLIFGIVGIVIIHIANLLRLVLLYYTAINNEEYFYYFHKYLFTAVLYVIVFCLWLFWIWFHGLRNRTIKSE